MRENSRIRRAREADVAAVAHIYDELHDAEEVGEAVIGWARGVYPTETTAADAFRRGELFVLEDGDAVRGAAIINQTQVDVYAGAPWAFPAADSEVCVLHTLVISPRAAGAGHGRAFVRFYEEYARSHGCRALRLDTNARNTRARKLYAGLGYREIAVVPTTFNGIGGVKLVLLEKPVRCPWCNENNPRYVRYHDTEWSRPCHDDRALFELLVLESFQAGLSWECVLNKREAFRRAFDGFEAEKVASYGEEKRAALAADAGIVRNRRKIAAAVRNAAVFLAIRAEFGSFDRYLWHFTDGRSVREDCLLRTTSPLSDAISADLKRRGMTFVGSTIVYSYLQAAGVLDAHTETCFFAGRGIAFADEL